MKAARLHAFGQPLVMEDVEMPEPGPGQFWFVSRLAALVTAMSMLPAVNGKLSSRACRCRSSSDTR